MCWHVRDTRVASDDADAHERRQRDFAGDAARFGAIVMICVLVWLLTGAGAFWPIWVIGIGGVKLGVRAREAYATADDY